jgi:hypothetical protein
LVSKESSNPYFTRTEKELANKENLYKVVCSWEGQTYEALQWINTETEKSTIEITAVSSGVSSITKLVATLSNSNGTNNYQWYSKDHEGNIVAVEGNSSTITVDRSTIIETTTYYC